MDGAVLAVRLPKYWTSLVHLLSLSHYSHHLVYRVNTHPSLLITRRIGTTDLVLPTRYINAAVR